MFHSVARRYDLMNDLMSAGLHRAWKDALVTAVNPPKDARPFALLDLAGGTGDVAFRVAAAAGPGTRVTVARHQRRDARGRPRRARRTRARRRHRIRRGQCGGVAVSRIGAMTPSRSRSASATCRASSARSPRLIACSRLGGQFHCLEFSSVDVPGLDRALRSLFIQRHPGARPRGGRRRRGLSLSGRIDPQVSEARIFADMIRAAGFRRVSFQPLTGGVVALHSGWRL